MSALTQISATAQVFTEPVIVQSVTIASVDGATSGAGKVELRDGGSGDNVVLTLRCLQDTTVPWRTGRSGANFSNGLHATISGAGPGILVSIEYD